MSTEDNTTKIANSCSWHKFVASPAYSVHLEVDGEVSSTGQIPNASMFVRMLVARGALDLTKRNGWPDSESFTCLVEAPQESAVVGPRQIKLIAP